MSSVKTAQPACPVGDAPCAVHRPLLSGQDVALQESVLEILRALLDPSSMTVKVATQPLLVPVCARTQSLVG